MGDRRKSKIITATVLLVLVIGYAIAEVGYRVHKFNQLRATYTATSAGYTTTEGPFYQVDEQAGYQYTPNAHLELRFYDAQGNYTGGNKLHSNNKGHISPRDDALSLGAEEFRIVCLGDSFTAITPTEIPWATRLEDRLNRDPRMKALTGKSVFKVLNLGLDGTGIRQWPSVYRAKGAPFKPDLVFVNFMWNDPYRKFLYRNTIRIPSQIATYHVMVISPTLPVDFSNPDSLYASAIVVDRATADNKEKMARIRREIGEFKVRSLPWFSPRPELLVLALGGRSSFDMRENPTPMSDDMEEAIEASLKALREIAAAHPRLVVAYHPTVQECLARKEPEVVRQLIERGEALHIQNMLRRLPVDRTPDDEIKKWYNLPYDQHPSGQGCELYAAAVHQLLIETLSRREGAGGFGQTRPSTPAHQGTAQ